MRNFLLTCLLFVGSFAFAQAPTITGDVMLCPYTNGTATITGSTTYDTYQWYYKFWFTNDEYEAIPGATSASFTYDWYTYDQSLFKVVVTQGGQTYESNTIQIDSYNWVSLTVMHSPNENVSEDGNGGFLLCPGGQITNTVGSPYSSVQWFKDGVAIPGATNTTYVITQPGEYYVTAAPGYCPESTSTSVPITVGTNANCSPQTGAPVIAGDVMLCPYTNGTAEITNGQTYETYQWYYKYWFTDDEFVAIDGATSASFTYDWLTYDQALLKVVVTQDGETYESNTIQIDSHNWASLIVFNSSNEYATEDGNGGYLLCPGGEVTNTVGTPYVTAQWFKDGVAIEGATGLTYVITEPGTYHVVAAPEVCPNATSSTITQPTVVSLNPECIAGLDDISGDNAFIVYPNPASSTLNLQLPQNSIMNEYTIFDVTGKNLMSGSVNTYASAINISGLAAGTYIIKLNGGQAQATKMFIKN